MGACSSPRSPRSPPPSRSPRPPGRSRRARRPGRDRRHRAHKPYLIAHAEGVQIYACYSVADGYAWRLLAPRATLTGDNGKPLGSHYGGPTWEARDGSTVVGAASGRAVDPAAIDWLRLAGGLDDGRRRRRPARPPPPTSSGSTRWAAPAGRRRLRRGHRRRAARDPLQRRLRLLQGDRQLTSPAGPAASPAARSGPSEALPRDLPGTLR